MKSVKPGRGPSLLGGAASAIAAVIGVVWIAVAASMDAPVYFCLFGVVFVVLAIAHALYDLYNATAKRRFSLFDVTEEGEEPDPLAREDGSGGVEAFCTACGAVIDLHKIPMDANLNRAVREQYGFEVQRHELTFYGKCHACMQAEKNEEDILA